MLIDERQETIVSCISLLIIIFREPEHKAYKSCMSKNI
jgi:hypothetical protein